MQNAICQNYEESERGWGTRPDGHSLHLSFEDARKFAQEYCRLGVFAVAPDEYSRPRGEPFPIVVDDNTFKKLEKARKSGESGIWGHPSRNI